jgi:hypothetical protein
MKGVPSASPAEPIPPLPSRRSLLRGGTFLGLSAATGTALAPRAWGWPVMPAATGQASARAAGSAPGTDLILDYQPSQPTGWGQGFTPTIGGHTSSANFTYQGSDYIISLLPFGQPGDSPSPVYEDVPVDPTVDFKQTLADAYGTYYSFRYMGGRDGRDEFSVESYNVFANEPTQSAPALNFGADLYVVYSPGRSGDPAIHKGLQWIQVIYWPEGPGGTRGPGGAKSTVDDDGRANPFYIAGGLTSIDGNQVVSFYDRPQTLMISQGNTTISDLFISELFLARDTGTKDAAGKEIVNIFGGLKYGWQVQSIG